MKESFSSSFFFFFFNKFARVFDSSVISCGCFISTTRDSRVVSAQIPDDSPVETEFKDLDFYSLCTRLSFSLSFSFLLSTLLSLLSTTRADLLSSTTRSSIVKTFDSQSLRFYVSFGMEKWCYVCLGNFANRSGGLSLLYTRCWKYKHRLLGEGMDPFRVRDKLRHRVRKIHFF